MLQHNFTVGPVDTDSISICKHTGIPFSKEELDSLLKEINDISPEFMEWSDDGYYSHCIAIRAKNYVLKDFNGKVTIKGSALKASTKSPVLKQFIRDIIDNILEDKNDYVEIYNKYAKQIADIKDITPWCVRKTISEKVLKNDRPNEVNVREAIEGTEIVEGDRCFMFYKDSGELCLAEKFTGDYSRNRLYQSLYDTMKVFVTILPLVTPNYKLKKNKKLLALL